MLLLCICLAVILRNPFGALAQQAYPACHQLHLEQNVYICQVSIGMFVMDGERPVLGWLSDDAFAP